MPKVLVIDDSVSVRKVVERALAGRQIEVVSAASGSEALERIEQDPPDVIVCDVVMPDRDGYEICEFVKNHPRLGKTPVVLMSGIVNDEVRDRAAKARAEGVLSKPFAAEDLLKRLDGVLGPIPARAPDAPAAVPVSQLTVPPLAPVVMEPRATPPPRTIAPAAAAASVPTGTPTKLGAPSIGSRPATPFSGPSRITPPSLAAPPKPTTPSIAAPARPAPPSITASSAPAGPSIAPPVAPSPSSAAAPEPPAPPLVVTPPDLTPPSIAVQVEVAAPMVSVPTEGPAPSVAPPRPSVEPPAPPSVSARTAPESRVVPAGAAEPAPPVGDSAAAILKQFSAMDGVQWAVLADREGFVVEATAKAGVDADVAAALSACLAESSEGLGRDLGRGTLHGLILEYEKGMIVMYGAGKAGLLAVGLTESAVLGKVRYFAKKALPELMRVL